MLAWMVMGLWTLVGILGTLTMSWVLGETTLTGLAAFCTVSESVVDAQSSTAVAGAWGHLDGIASSRFGSRMSSGVVAWTEYIAHASGDTENRAAVLNFCTKFDLCIHGGAPVT